jgi:hypothetical protein
MQLLVSAKSTKFHIRRSEVTHFFLTRYSTALAGAETQQMDGNQDAVKAYINSQRQDLLTDASRECSKKQSARKVKRSARNVDTKGTMQPTHIKLKRMHR